MRATHYTHLLHAIGIVENRVMSCVDLSEGLKENMYFECIGNSLLPFFCHSEKFHCELKNGNFSGTLSVRR